MVLITYSGKTVIQTELRDSVQFIKNEIKTQLGLKDEDYYLIKNGKRFTDAYVTEECIIHIVPKLTGGKGGFGSMLRAIGAQIEKTTNREACRDLSGRRLRDINEEKRLKTWMTQQVDREQEADDRKQKKLERLCQVPKHEFRDEDYEKERQVLTEKVEDALEQGLKASTSTNTIVKRKQPEEKAKAKKKKLWLGSEDELSSSSDVDSEEDDTNSKSKDSAEESDNKGKESLTEEKKSTEGADTETENSSEKKKNEIEQTKVEKENTGGGEEEEKVVVVSN